MDRFSDSLEDQIAVNCGPETGNFSPWYGLEQMSLDEVRLLDPFRDDPVRENADDGERVSDSSIIESEEEDVRDKNCLFECCCLGSCSDELPGYMKEEEERKCCKGSSWSTLDLSGFDCITDHPILDKLLDKEILEVMLSVVVEVTRGDSEVNPRNLRFAAYRCIFHWLFKKKHPRNVVNYREVIPTCVVKLVRARFPELEPASYTGFKQVGKRKIPGKQASKKKKNRVALHGKTERVAAETSTADGAKAGLRVTGISSSAGGVISIPGEEEMPEDSLSVGVRYLTGPDFSPIFKRKSTLESARTIAVSNAAVDRRKTGDTSSDED